MEPLERKPFQGITNIIRFNWHYYIFAFVVVTFLFFIKNFLSFNVSIIATVIALLTILSTLISLFVSWYIYDYSDLYSLNWMRILNVGPADQLVNINAGFDETSSILTAKYPFSKLIVFDFYDPGKHTEISIERARKAYPVFPGTKTISTREIPLKTNSADYIFLILAAHEIRSNEERILFFQQLENILCIDGRIILTEHLRDVNNFIAYNFGFFHFLSKHTWKQTFEKAGLQEDRQIKITPFISTFILKKNGVIS